MASVLVDGLEIEVDGFVCVLAPRDGAHIAIRFRTDAVLHDVAGLSLRRDVHLGFEVSGSVYHGHVPTHGVQHPSPALANTVSPASIPLLSL